MPSWILAIDFGTSYTVAASKIGDRSPELIEIGGERRMPSVIMAEPNGTIVVGRTADDLSGTHPESTLRALKNRLGDQAPVVLDGRPYQVVELVAALLKEVYTESVRQLGEPPAEVRLTHPAMWNRPRLNRLLEAASKAGITGAALVPEPVAAALSFATEVGVAQGAHVVVYDLGGGTFDSAVVTASGGGFAIVGRPSGDQNIGGELFDELIVNHLGLQLPADAWDAIQIGEEPLWQQVGATLRNEARRAKETLSGNPYADLIVPLPTGLKQIRLKREEFEELVMPYIAETVVLLDRCVTEAGLDASRLSGISLVGGSSRSPIVERMVKAAFPTVAVIRRGDPKTAVASGAARAVRSSISTLPTSGRTSQDAGLGTAQHAVNLVPPISSPPGATSPISHPLAPPSHPTAPVSHPTSPVSAPVSSPPVATAFSSAQTPYPPTPNPPTPNPPTVVPAGVGAPPPPNDPNASNAKRPSKKRLAVVGGLVLAVVAAAVVFIVSRGPDSKNEPTRQALTDALLTIRQVRDTFGTGWNAEALTGGSDPFCPQFSLAEPTRQSDALWSTVDNGTTVTNFGFYENIATFASADAASKFYEQDKAITQNCKKSNGTLGLLPVTYTITDVTKQADSVGRVVVAIKYEASPADGSSGVILTGYIVETMMSKVIVQTNCYIYNREPEKSEIVKYYELTKLGFDKAAQAL